ncbi:hypothetical protein [Rhodococcus koreensis]
MTNPNVLYTAATAPESEKQENERWWLTLRARIHARTEALTHRQPRSPDAR